MTTKTEVYNQDELEAPEWMNDDFFLKVLKNCESKTKNIKLISTKISPASMKGDHYASVMFRALVEYELSGVRKTRSLILKTMPESEGHKKEMLGESDIFLREIAMYTEVLPRFEKILRKAGDETVLKANCLYSQLVPKQVIVFEDLVVLGYEVMRDRRLNEHEVTAAYSKLAKLHAISYKINLEEPTYFDKFQNGLFNLPKIEEQSFLTKGIDFFVEMLSKTPSLHKFVPYFKNLQPILFDKCRTLCAEYRKSRQNDAYYVLCHGDYHEKNMMLKFAKGDRTLEDVMLLDYQICYVGSITYDLIYSFYCLLSEELRLEFPKLLYNYYTVFIDTLKKIGFEGELPKLTKIREERVRHKYIELFLLVTFLPWWYGIQETKDLDIENMMTSDDCRRQMYKTEGYISYVEKALSRYLYLGYFEDL